MAKTRQSTGGGVKTTDYRHRLDKRTNIPPAKIAAEGKVPTVPKAQYHYSPHLPPSLRFDPMGKADKLPQLLRDAGRRPLTEAEQRLVGDALQSQHPWLEWAGKREQHERGLFQVDPVALHIHERISTQAMLRVLAREDVQRDLFADPQQTYAQAVQFYKHDVDWANRIILGDSLQVMTSLARREHLAGKVQMIYVDPPYGIRFASNFQPQLGQRDVKDRDQDLTREPEMVRAYRDTWTLGVHSYLAYLRDRFIVARDLLADTGSIFIQISDENMHRVRLVMDEVFRSENCIGTIVFSKTSSATVTLLPNTCDYILWYAKDKSKAKYRALYYEKYAGGGGAEKYDQVVEPNGHRRPLMSADLERSGEDASAVYRLDNITSQSVGRDKGEGAACWFPVSLDGREFRPSERNRWKTNEEGMTRLLKSERVLVTGNSIGYVRYLKDFAAAPLTDVWTDIGGIQSRADPKIYVVQTSVEAVKRCMLMSTDAGDLVLDPTCGSGTTAYVAEQWGRRWITCDTSRVALALARQRLMTARFPYYHLRPLTAEDLQRNPQGTWLVDPAEQTQNKRTFKCKNVPHVTLKSIARNAALDPVFAKHEPIVTARLHSLNHALKTVTAAVRQKLLDKLAAKRKSQGTRAITDADRRRWELPKGRWEEWEVPFDTDPDWPKPLQQALTEYRAAWRAKADAVNACIAANGEIEELVDKPEPVSGVVRVTGPFTVEGVRPEELSLGDAGLFDPTPNAFEGSGAAPPTDRQNVQAYLAQMLKHLRTDGLTFLGNQRRQFRQLDPLFEDASGSLIHAEGSWDTSEGSKDNTVAVSFGPQHGPVTALQVEEAIRAAKQYDDLVLAGFSFDAEAFAVVQEASHPKLRIHLAHIRPDLNEAMDGLLKDIPNSELFAVFGQPDIGVQESEDGWVCTLKGVEIYNPLDNTVRSCGADKVAAWFLDGDFDGRCFCITQAFFPDQNAWEKIAKALGSAADTAAFERLKGTTSVPFGRGKYGRIAVKVIDPRGNEVMAIRSLK